MSEKLQKVLARAGLASRRTIEEWIQAGRVCVNGEVAHLGMRVSLPAEITVDAKRVDLQSPAAEVARVLLYHKPEGLVCSSHDPEGRPTVFEDLPVIRGARWIMVGRLDINTSGLLLFTTNGELAKRLMHPRYQVTREYAVRILGKVAHHVIEQLLIGVQLEDGIARFDSVVDAGGSGINHWYHVTIHEGRNREVRRLWESQGLKVSRLIRIRFGIITLPRLLRKGKFQELDANDVTELAKSVGLTLTVVKRRVLKRQRTKR